MIEFTKDGIKFLLRNPKWDAERKVLSFEYKAPGNCENLINNGFFQYGEYSKTRKCIRFTFRKLVVDDVRLDDLELPEDINEVVLSMYNEYMDKTVENEYSADLKYYLYDTKAGGIYNGLKSYDVCAVLIGLEKEMNLESGLYSSVIAKKLNKDPEFKKIAEGTYIPNPEDPNWTDDYKAKYRALAAERKVAGYGIIPNILVKEKVKAMIIDEMENIEDYKYQEEQRIKNIFELAKMSGERQIIHKWSEKCNSHYEDCNLDIVYEYAMPDGTKELARYHTY